MEEFRKLEAFCKEHGIGYDLRNGAQLSKGVKHYTAHVVINEDDIFDCWELTSRNGKYEEHFFDHEDLFNELEVLFDAPKLEEKNRAEYNRRRSEIALTVATGIIVAGQTQCDRDELVKAAFNWAEAFLAEEAKRNGENQ